MFLKGLQMPLEVLYNAVRRPVRGEVWSELTVLEVSTWPYKAL